MALQQDDPFQYFLSENSGLLVVSLVGALRDASLPQLADCKTEVTSRDDIKSVVLNLSGVTQVSTGTVALLTQIQREIRSKQIQLRVFLANAEVKERLVREGVLRSLEIADSLESAIRIVRIKTLSEPKVRNAA